MADDCGETYEPGSLKFLCRSPDPDRMRSCGYCPEQIPSSKMEEHFEEFHVRCTYCNNQMPRKVLKLHLYKKHHVETSCTFCVNLEPQTDVQCSHRCERIPKTLPRKSLQTQELTGPIDDPYFNARLHFIDVRMTYDQFNQFIKNQQIVVKDGKCYFK